MIRIWLIGVVSVVACKRAPVDIDVPVVWEGASVMDVEKKAVLPLERALAGLPNLVHTSSVSRVGGAHLTASFKPGSDAIGARRDVSDAIARADSHPDAHAAALIHTQRRLRFALKTSTLTLTQLRDVAETQLRHRLLTMPGVVNVELCGGAVSRIEIRTDGARLISFGLTVADVVRALSAVNVSQPAGSIDGPRRDFAIQIGAAKPLDGLVIAYKNGAPIRLTDVATVTDSGEGSKCEAWVERQRAVVATVALRDDADVAAIERMAAQVGATLPPMDTVTALPASTGAIRVELPAAASKAALYAIGGRLGALAPLVELGADDASAGPAEARLQIRDDVNVVAKQLAQLPSLRIVEGPTPRITIVLAGDDLDVLRAFARHLGGVVEGDDDVPQVENDIDRVSANRRNLDVATIAEALSYTGEGRVVSTIFGPSSLTRIWLRLDGEVYPEVVSSRTVVGPAAIFHEDGGRVVRVHFFGAGPDPAKLRQPPPGITVRLPP